MTTKKPPGLTRTQKNDVGTALIAVRNLIARAFEIVTHAKLSRDDKLMLLRGVDICQQALAETLDEAMSDKEYDDLQKILNQERHDDFVARNAIVEVEHKAWQEAQRQQKKLNGYNGLNGSR